MQEPLPVLRATPHHEAGLSPSALRRRTGATGSDRVVRVGPNAFVPVVVWERAGPRQRYVTRVVARLDRLARPVAASHESAAAVLDLPHLLAWPDDVHVTVPRSRRRASRTGIVLHSRPVDASDVVSFGDRVVTSPARTVVDIALARSFRSGVVVADAALSAGIARSEIRAALDRHPEARARVQAADVIAFADGASGSAAESLARVVFDELGLPRPVLQQRFVVDGAQYFVDFWFPDHGVVVEIDGRAKYTQQRWLRGRDPADVIVAEKRRTEALLTLPVIHRIVRAEWRDLVEPARLVPRLRASGLPAVLGSVRLADVG
jgi:hypothetical protein